MMNRLLGMALLGVVFLLPGTALGEAFDVQFCKSGTYSLLHDSKEIPPVYVWEEKGMLLKAGDSDVFQGMTVQCAGIQIGRRDQRSGDAFCKMVGPDGDLIIAGLPYQGMGSTWRFLYGTGKYSGIQGSGKASRIARGKSVQPGTYQRCSHIKGEFQLKK